MSPAEAKDSPLFSLVKELVDALAELVAGHLRLARAEIGADARRLGRHAALVSLAAAIALVGYGLACVAAGLALAPVMGAPLAFLALGGVHLVGASVVVGVLLARAPKRPLGESFAAADRTVRSIAVAALPPSAEAARPAAPRLTNDDALPAVQGAVP